MSSGGSSFKIEDIINIIKKVEFLKTLYYSPNTYKICSLEPQDINNIFFGDTHIYIKDESFYEITNKTDENKKEYLFKCFIEFIYIDITDIDIIINPNNYYDSKDSKDSKDSNNRSIIGKLINELKSDFTDTINNYIKNFLDKDNKSYLQIYGEINKDRPYIEYNQNPKRLFIKNFLDLVLEILKTNYIINTSKNDFLIKIIIKILSKINITKIKQFNSININNINTVDNILQEYSNDTIITYLKIRNTPVNYTISNKIISTSESDYNKSRFDIKLYGNAGKFPDTLLVKYNNNSKKFPENEQINEYDKYTNEYLFGPFNRIYNFDENNKNIAGNLNDIVNSLKNNKDVFIIGYGASGSGKTSTLVYLKNNNITEEGIIIHVCKSLTDTYNKFNVKCREFFTENNTNVVRKIPEDDNQSIPFTFKNDSILLDNDYEYAPKWSSKDGSKKKFKQNDNIGDVILYLIDKDRFVKPTTNNPKSSRSHSLVFIELIGNDNKKVNFIIGDFAGVENRFNCDDNNVENFYKINTGNNNYYLEKFQEEYKEENDEEFNDSYYPELNYNKKNYENIKNILLNEFFKKVLKKSETDKGIRQDIKNYLYNKIKIKYNDINNIFNKENYEERIKDIFYNDITNILIEKKNNKNNIQIDQIFNEYFDNIMNNLKDILEKINDDDIKTNSKSDKITNLVNKNTIKTIQIVNFSNLSELQYLSLYTNDKPLDPSFSFIIFLKKIIEEPKSNILNTIIDYWKGLFNEVVLKIKEEDKKKYSEDKDKYKTTAKDKSKKEYIKNICETRTKEGIYINESLKDVRSFITFLLKEKNKNKISISPQFVNNCFPYYCNSDKCFDINTLQGDSNSKIFEEIKNILKPESLNDFINKIIISIFCVFNISVNVNNPPPVPYVDINDIQIIFNKYNNIFEYTKINEYINILKPKFDSIITLLNDYGQTEASNYVTDKSTTIYIFINKNSKGAYDSVNNNVKELINYFNNYNSISSIGTLEFLDKISKFNLTNVICGVSF